jgi:hypothetical protein
MAGPITDLERHVARLLWFCMALTSVVVLVLEAGLGPQVRAFLGQEAPDAVAASRALVLASVPYGVFVCLRCALDACHDTAFNTQHVVASTAVFGALVGGVLVIDPFAYSGPLWTFLIAVWATWGPYHFPAASGFRRHGANGARDVSQRRRPA